MELSLAVGESAVRLVADGAEGAPAVLFAHPFPLHSGAWDGVRAALVAHGMRALAIDAPGFGGSPARGRPLEMDDLAAALRAALDALQVERAVLCGCSMGGYASMAFARLFPERLRAAIFLCTKASPDTAEAKARRESQAEAALARGPQEVTGPMATSLLAPDAAPAVRAQVRALAAGATAQGIADALRGMALRPDARPSLRALAVPALVVAGERDQLMPRAELDALAAAIPGARYETVTGAGHLPFLERPEETLRLLLAFLDALPA